MIVEKVEINASGSFRISRNYQFSASCQQQPKMKSFVVDQTALDWMVTLKNSECDILHWQELLNVNYEETSFSETSGIKLSSVLENVYDKPKLKTTKIVVRSLYGGAMAAIQTRIKMSNSNNSQRSQFNNAEIVRCLTPISHPVCAFGEKADF